MSMQHKLRPITAGERAVCMEAFNRLPKSIRDFCNLFPVTVDMRSFPNVLKAVERNGAERVLQLLAEQGMKQLIFRGNGADPRSFKEDVMLACRPPTPPRRNRVSKRAMKPVPTYEDHGVY